MAENILENAEIIDEVVVEAAELEPTVDETSAEADVASGDEIVATTEETEPEVTVDEAEGGANIMGNHTRSDPDMHTIGAITGLEQRLTNIETLKPVRASLGGHADYYLWGETEDIGPGYFVKLGEDGMIRKAAKETLVVCQKGLELDKDDNGVVIIYAAAGSIKTADTEKFYVVKTSPSDEQPPHDIYGYDGIEYVQKTAYQYTEVNGEMQVVRTCQTSDVLGVTVPAAGFVGNDEDIDGTHTSKKALGLNTEYALVQTEGVVDVLCHNDVVVGDYVYPVEYGMASKSTGSYGYLVTALVQRGEIVETIDHSELLYARIVLAPSVIHLKKVSDNVDYLLGETKRLDGNISSFGSAAEAALKLAEELTEAARQSAVDSANNAQEANSAAQDAQQSANNAWDAASGSTASAQQAAKDAQEAAATALTIRDEAIAEANELATKIATDKLNETLDTVKALQLRLDEHTVGQYSQAYGLSYEQAKAILPIGTAYIPMSDNPTSHWTYTEYYKDAAGDVRQDFTVGYAYMWDGTTWLTGNAVLVSRTPTEQTEGDYWYVPEDYKDVDYKCGALYRWESGQWVEKAVRVENTMSRTIAHLYHEDDTIRQSVSTVDNKVAAVETKVSETDARVGLVASVPVELEGVKPGNYNEDTESLDVIKNKEELDNLDTAQNGKYYVVGEGLPYTVYQFIDNEFKPVQTIAYDGVNFYKINVASIFTTANEEGSSVQLNATKIQFNGEGIFHDENGITRINGNAITTGKVKADFIDTDNLTVKAANITGELVVNDGLGKEVTKITETTLETTNVVAENLKVKAANVDGVLLANEIRSDAVKSKNYQELRNEEFVAADADQSCVYYDSGSYYYYKDGEWASSQTDPRQGSFLDLEDGSFDSANFKIGTDGAIQATSGEIGGWSIGSNMLTAKNGAVGLQSRGTSEILNFPSISKEDWKEVEELSVDIMFPPIKNKSVQGQGEFIDIDTVQWVYIAEETTTFSVNSDVYDTCKIDDKTVGSDYTQIETETTLDSNTTIVRSAMFTNGVLTLKTTAKAISQENGTKRLTAFGKGKTVCFSTSATPKPKQVIANNIYPLPEDSGYSSFVIKNLTEQNILFNKGTTIVQTSSDEYGNTIILKTIFEDYKLTLSVEAYGPTPVDVPLTEVEVDVEDLTILWSGNKPQNAPFSVTSKGELKATVGEIAGFSINETAFNNENLFMGDVLFGADTAPAFAVGEWNDSGQFIPTTYMADGYIYATNGQFARADVDILNAKEELSSSTIKAERILARSDASGSAGLSFEADVNTAPSYKAVLYWSSFRQIFQIQIFDQNGNLVHSPIGLQFVINYISTSRNGTLFVDVPAQTSYVTVPFESNTGWILSASLNGTDNQEVYFKAEDDEDIVVIASHCNFLPYKNGEYALGSEGKRWANIWTDNINATTAPIDDSDINLKNNIMPLTDAHAKLFDKLQPVSFKLNSGTSNRTHTGLIAQDLKQAIEDVGLTTQDFAAYCEWQKEDGTQTCGIRYTELIALNIQQIQMLKARVAEQDDKIKDLEARLLALENK